MTTTSYAHIDFKPSGAPIIKGTRFRVDLIVKDYIEGRMSPDEIAASYPPLTLGQVHAALAWYYDHKDEMDRQVKEDDRRDADLRARLDQGPQFLERLRQEGRIS